jgi:hypothetical protein
MRLSYCPRPRRRQSRLLQLTSLPTCLTTISICVTFKNWRSRAVGCSKARMSKDAMQHHEETSLRQSRLDTKHRCQQ